MRGNPRIVLRIDPELLAQLRRLASFADTSVSEVVREMIQAEINKPDYQAALGK